MAAKAVSVSPRLQGISRGEGMKSQQAFIEAARGIAELIQGRAEALEPEIRQTEARLREMEAERQAARDTPERLTNFTPMVGGNYQCPLCWIIKEARRPVRPLVSNTRGDAFVCDACAFEVVVPESQ
jgi:hypothetical protein